VSWPGVQFFDRRMVGLSLKPREIGTAPCRDGDETYLAMSISNWQDLIENYWTNFASRGNPNAEGLPTWREFDGSQTFIEFTQDGRGASATRWCASRAVRSAPRSAEAAAQPNKTVMAASVRI